jgi:hypothetical protein
MSGGFTDIPGKGSGLPSSDEHFVLRYYLAGISSLRKICFSWMGAYNLS